MKSIQWFEAGLEALATDGRHGLRRLRRRPAFALLAVTLVGVGIGLNVALFSIADAVLLGPLPFDEPEQLYSIWPERMFNKEMVDRAGSELESWQKVGAYTIQWSYPVSGVDPGTAPPEQVSATLVSANFFDVLGLRPWRGSFFRDEDARPGSDALVLSYELWQRRFGGDEEAVGSTLIVDGIPRRIVGVLAPGARLLGRENHLWLPYSLDRTSSDYLSSFYLRPVGRLAESVTAASAVAELAAFSARLEADDPRYEPHDFMWPPQVERLRSHLFGSSAELLQVLALAAGAVLLLACANVAHLLLVQTESRRGELALLTALGAGRYRLVRSILVETLLLAFAGGGVGWLVAAWSRSLLVTLLPEHLPRRAELTVDGRALAASVLLALLVTVVVALLPARRALALNPVRGLRRSRGGVAGTGPTQRWLVTLEVAAVLALVMAAALLGRSLYRLSLVDPGVDVAGAVTLRVHPPSQNRSPEEVQTQLAAIVERLNAVPGVQAAGGIQLLPLSGEGNWAFPYLAEDAPVREGPLPSANFRVVTPGYAAAAGLQLLAGRDFQRSDRSDSQAVGWVNRTMARQLWPGDEAVGKVIRLFGDQPFTVVGVVADVHQLGLRRTPEPAMYRPLTQFGVSSLHLVVRGEVDAMSLVPSLRTALAEVAPDVPVADVRSFADVVRASVDTPRFTARLTGGFAALALFLGCCGIFAVLAQLVQGRRGEIGVRLALGADARRIEREVLREALGLALRGVVLGAIAAVAIGWWLRSQLYSVGSWDPAALSMALMAALTAVVAGTWWPARRAAQVDPAEALRAE